MLNILIAFIIIVVCYIGLLSWLLYHSLFDDGSDVINNRSSYAATGLKKKRGKTNSNVKGKRKVIRKS